MAFFLLPLAAAALGLGGRGLAEYMSAGEDEARAGTMLEALRSARREVPGSEIGATGPELPATVTDWGAVGEALLEAGDPAGLNIAMQAASRRDAGVLETMKSEREFQEKMLLEQYKQTQQNQRQQIELAAKERRAEADREAGRAPVYHSPGSPGWSAIADEGASLKYASSILRDFQDGLAQYGTESWGERSGALAGKRQQLMLFLKEGEQTGAIDAGTVELFERMLPDVTALTGDALGAEAGKLNALIDLFNSKYIPAYNARSLYTSNVPKVGMIPSEELIPEGLEPVDEGFMQREREMMGALDAEARAMRGANVTYGAQRENEQALDELTRAAQGGMLRQRR